MFTQAVAQLEQSGVIDQSQERIIDQQLAVPGFSIMGLVSSGTITSAQEQQLLPALQQAKQSQVQGAQPQVRAKSARKLIAPAPPGAITAARPTWTCRGRCPPRTSPSRGPRRVPNPTPSST